MDVWNVCRQAILQSIMFTSSHGRTEMPSPGGGGESDTIDVLWLHWFYRFLCSVTSSLSSLWLSPQQYHSSHFAWWHQHLAPTPDASIPVIVPFPHPWPINEPGNCPQAPINTWVCFCLPVFSVWQWFCSVTALKSQQVASCITTVLADNFWKYNAIAQDW